MPRLPVVLAVAGVAAASVSMGAGAHDGAHYDHGDAPYSHRYDGQLSPDTRRTLRHFNEQKHRDYRRLGKRHFDSHQGREHAYRQLRRHHCQKLRDILGDSRIDQDCSRHRYDDHDRQQHRQHRPSHHHSAAHTVDPRSLAASLAARWALNASDQDDLADALEDYQEDAREFHQERFDDPQERREARRDLEEDYQDDLEDILDDLSDNDADDILERVLDD